MNRFSHHRTFCDAFSSKKLFSISCINSLWINDNASRVISLYCLHCFVFFSFSFLSIIKIIQEKSKLMDRKRSCFKLLNQNVGCYWSGMIISLKYSMMINFREKVGKKKKMILTRTCALKGEERKSQWVMVSYDGEIMWESDLSYG